MAYTDNILTGSRVRGPQGRDGRRAARAARARRREPRRRTGRRHPGQQQRQPDGDRRRGRPAHPARRARHRRVHGAGGADARGRCWRRSRWPDSRRSSCTPRRAWSTSASWSASVASAPASSCWPSPPPSRCWCFDVLLGIVAAIALSVLDLLRRVARPHDAVLGIVPGMAGMHDVDDYPVGAGRAGADDLPLRLAAVLRQRRGLPPACPRARSTRPRSRSAGSCSTRRRSRRSTSPATDALEELRKELDRRGIEVGIARMKEELREELAGTAFLRQVPADRIFATLPTTVEAYQEWAAAWHPGWRPSTSTRRRQTGRRLRHGVGTRTAVIRGQPNPYLARGGISSRSS